MTQRASSHDLAATSPETQLQAITEVRGERQTGTRARQDRAQVQTDSAAEHLNSERPEAFRKPFASLAPPSDFEVDSALYTAPHTTQVSIRPKNAYTYCARHKLAKNRLGQCMMCERETKSTAADLNWKVPVVLVAVAVTLGALIAAYL